MPLHARFRVNQVEEITVTRRVRGLQPQVETGVRIRMEPAALPSGQDADWYANSLNGVIGITIMGPGAKKFVLGFEFDWPIPD